MTRETHTFTQTRTYNVFEVGERVRFNPQGRQVWTVTAFLHPHSAADEATVFLEGYPYGVDAALLVPAEEGYPWGVDAARVVPAEEGE